MSEEPQENTSGRQGRYQFLMASYAAKIHEYIVDENDAPLAENENSAFEIFASYDPTAESEHKPYVYLQWLCAIFEQAMERGDSFTVADLERLKHNIELFTDFKRRYPQAGFEKDIQRYDDEKLQMLANYIESGDYRSETSKEKDSKASIMEETVIHYSGREGIIVTPLTKKASNYWGRNTRWCTTAAVSDNRFESYNKNGPLIIFIAKKHEGNDNTKFQAHKTGGLCNAADAYVSTIPENLGNLIDAAVTNKTGFAEFLFRNGGSFGLGSLKKKVRTLETCRAALQIALESKQGGTESTTSSSQIQKTEVNKVLDKVPSHIWQDEEFALKALQHSPQYAFKMMPEEYKTAQCCFKALMLDNSASILKDMPGHIWHNTSFCELALDKTGQAQFISERAGPEPWRSESFCIKIIKETNACEEYLQRIHHGIWLNKEFCKAAWRVSKDTDRMLDYVLASAKGMEVPPKPVRNNEPSGPGNGGFGTVF